MENKDTWPTVPKWVLIVWPKIPQMLSKFLAQFVCQNPKVLVFRKKLFLVVRSPCICIWPHCHKMKMNKVALVVTKHKWIQNTGTPPLTQFFWAWKKPCFEGKPHYRRSILVLKPKNGDYESSKSTFLWISKLFSWFFSLNVCMSSINRIFSEDKNVL